MNTPTARAIASIVQMCIIVGGGVIASHYDAYNNGFVIGSFAGVVSMAAYFYVRGALENK